MIQYVNMLRAILLLAGLGCLESNFVSFCINQVKQLPSCPAFHASLHISSISAVQFCFSPPATPRHRWPVCRPPGVAGAWWLVRLAPHVLDHVRAAVRHLLRASSSARGGPGRLRPAAAPPAAVGGSGAAPLPTLGHATLSPGQSLSQSGVRGRERGTANAE